MTKWTEQDERRLTLLEHQVGALLAGRERMQGRINALREFIHENCQHHEESAEDDCPICRFLMEDAAK